VWAYTSDDLIVHSVCEQVGLRRGDASRFANWFGSGHPYPHAISSHHRARQRANSPRRGVVPPSDAALAWSWAVMACSSRRMNRALEPALMAEALRDAVRAGYLARRAGRIPTRLHAERPLAGARAAKMFIWRCRDARTTLM